MFRLCRHRCRGNRGEFVRSRVCIWRWMYLNFRGHHLGFFQFPRGRTFESHCATGRRNFGVAVGLLLIPRLEVVSWSLETAILDFSISGLVVQYKSPIASLEFKNVWTSIGISKIYCKEEEIQGFYHDFIWNSTIFDFAAVILNYWMVMDMPKLCQHISLNFMRFRIGSQTIGLRGW